MILLRWLAVLPGHLTDFYSPALLNLFIFSDPSIFSTVAFPPLENFDVVVSVSTDFPNELPDDIVCVIFLSILMILLFALSVSRPLINGNNSIWLLNFNPQDTVDWVRFNTGKTHLVLFE